MTDYVQPPWLQPAKPKGNPEWQPGMPSPNPSGRPPGIVDKRSKLRKALMSDAQEVLQVVIKAAKGGCIQSANIVLQRVLPTVKAQAERVKFELDPGASLTEQARQILSAIAAGKVDPDTGRMLLDCLSSLQGITQVDELATRMAELEAALLGRQA